MKPEDPKTQSKVVIDPERAARLLDYYRKFVYKKPGVVSSKENLVEGKEE